MATNLANILSGGQSVASAQVNLPGGASITGSGGAITLTAGPTNNNINLLPAGTGSLIVADGIALGSLAAPRFQGLQIAAGNSVRTSIYMDAVGTNGPTFVGRRAKGSYGSLTGVVANDTLAQYSGEGYGATGYVNTRPGLQVIADDTWTDSVAGAKLVLNVTLKGGTTSANALIANSDASVTVCANTATPAAGSTAAVLLFGTTAGFGIYYGSGAPTVTAAQGSLYLRSNGTTTNDRLYVNTNGSTTWTACTTVA